ASAAASGSATGSADSSAASPTGSSATGSSASAGASSASTAGCSSAGTSATVSSTASSAGVSVSSVSFTFSSAISSSHLLGSALVLDRQDAGDLASRPAQPGARLEPAGRGLEADAEELLPTLAELLAELLVGHRPELVSFQRDPPPASRTSCVPGASGRRGEAPRGRAAPGRRRARTSRD